MKEQLIAGLIFKEKSNSLAKRRKKVLYV